jgi:hypothetical protein
VVAFELSPDELGQPMLGSRPLDRCQFTCYGIILIAFITSGTPVHLAL